MGEQDGWNKQETGGKTVLSYSGWVDVLKCSECVLEVEILWVDMLDSWIESSGTDGFTPSEEHRTLMPVKTVTISLLQIHISCCFLSTGNNLGD